MTPSNPSNSQPLIYRIMDALGVSHLVACINHTHEQSEIEGLTSALSSLTSSIESLPTTEYVDTALAEKANQTDMETALAEKANQTDMETALAEKQDKLTFDSTPTASSTNPVTSGGVKAALDEFIVFDANNGQIPVSQFGYGKIYHILVTNPTEKWVHQYFTKEDASYATIQILGDKVVTSLNDFGMLVWRNIQNGPLYVLYQGEFVSQELDD